MSEDNDLHRLEQIGQQLDAIKKQKAVESEPSSSTAGMAGRIISELVAGVFVGVFIGFYLDKWLDTKPLFIMLCLLFSVVAAFFNIFRYTNRD